MCTLYAIAIQRQGALFVLNRSNEGRRERERGREGACVSNAHSHTQETMRNIQVLALSALVCYKFKTADSIISTLIIKLIYIISY